MASATFKTPAAAASPSSPVKTPDAHERSRRLAENAASERSRRDLEQNAQETAQSAKAGRKLAEMLASAEEERKNQRGGKPWYVLDPESTVVKFRDMASFLALVLTFAVVPFEVAFVDAPPVPDPTNALWIFNRFVDCLFLFDMALQFFIAFERSSTILEQMKAEGGEAMEDELAENSFVRELLGSGLEYRLRYIFCEYLKGWLLLDFGAMGPSFFEVYSAITAGAVSEALGSSNVTALGSTSYASTQDAATAARTAKTAKAVKFLRATRVLKLFRLLKLTKLLRAFKMLNDPDGAFMKLVDYVTLSFIAHQRKLAILKLLLIFVVLAHVQACILGLTAIIAEQRAHTWWGTLGYCFPPEDEESEMGSGGTTAALTLRRLSETQSDDALSSGLPSEIPCVDPFYQYFVCVTWAFEFYLGTPTFFTQTGPGTPIFLDDTNARFREHEYVLFVVCGVVGGLMGLYMQGRVVEVLTSPPNTAESVNKFCKIFEVKREIRQNLQVYFERLAKMSGTAPSGDLFSRLSPNLAEQVMLDVHGKWLAKLPFHKFITREMNPNYPSVIAMRRSIDLRRNAAALLSKIALAMQPTLLIPKERASIGRLYVILKGVAIEHRDGKLLSVNDSWGAVEAICGPLPPTVNVSQRRGRGEERVEALTFLQLYYIDHGEMDRIIGDYPELRDAYYKVRAWAYHKRLLIGIQAAADIELVKRARLAEQQGVADVAVIAQHSDRKGGGGGGGGGSGAVVDGTSSSSFMTMGWGAPSPAAAIGLAPAATTAAASTAVSDAVAARLMERVGALQRQQEGIEARLKASMQAQMEALKAEMKIAIRETMLEAKTGDLLAA